MIIVLEGAKGAGKSSLARLLNNITGWPVYRAFRTTPDDHKPQDAAWAAKIRLPVNTWLEDLYAADVFSVTKPNLILDRSMPSALTYEIMDLSKAPLFLQLETGMEMTIALRAWSERMLKADARLVVLKGEPEELHRRSGARSDPEDVAREQSTIARCSYSTRLPLLELSNHGATTETAVRILHWAKEGAGANAG